MARLLSGVLLAGLLAGCGTQLGGASIARLATGWLGDRGYEHAGVDCPDVDNEVGTRFTCTVSGVPQLTKIEGSVARHDEIRLAPPR